MTYVCMALAALAGGIIQPLTGFGSAVILIAVAQYFFDITVAPSVVAAICMFQSGIMAYQHRKKTILNRFCRLLLCTQCAA